MGMLTFLRTRNLWTLLQFQRDLHAFLRVNFLYAAFESGLLHALRMPASRDAVCAQLGIKRLELLDALLHVGVALDELEQSGEHYRLKGRRARLLTTPEGDALAAMIQEHVTYHGSVYRELNERLKGGPLGDYLKGNGTLIARSSRLLEPYVADFVRTTIRKLAPATMFEIGCGSGVYLRYAVQAKPDLTGSAIDMQPDVVAHARQNLAAWGVRFQVMVGNVLTPPPELIGPFDLVTLYNNIYYFPVEQRVALFQRVHAWLAPGGALALVSLFRGTSINSANFDLIVQSTLGCAPLPELDELKGQLRQAGFTLIEHSALAPGEPFYGILAHK